MVEMLNKELKEMKKGQLKINNAVNEIKKKNTLEWTKRRITETEDRISEVEGKTVEINEAERKKGKKNQKKWGQPQGPLGQCEMPQHSNHRSPEEEDIRKAMRKYSRR